MKRFLLSALLLITFAFGSLGCPSEGNIFGVREEVNLDGCIDHWFNCSKYYPFLVSGSFTDVVLVQECNAQMADCDDVAEEDWNEHGDEVYVECKKPSNTVVIWTCTGMLPRATNPVDNGTDTDLALPYDTGW